MIFGDYCHIEQKRHGAPNEMYQHKVIGRLRSNTWVDVPVQSPATETMHGYITDVIACICCGVQEREVRYYRAGDCRPTPETPVEPVETQLERLRAAYVPLETRSDGFAEERRKLDEMRKFEQG